MHPITVIERSPLSLSAENPSYCFELSSMSRGSVCVCVLAGHSPLARRLTLPFAYDSTVFLLFFFFLPLFVFLFIILSNNPAFGNLKASQTLHSSYYSYTLESINHLAQTKKQHLPPDPRVEKNTDPAFCTPTFEIMAATNKMANPAVDPNQEEKLYLDDVAAVKQWWSDSRWRYTKRPFTAEQIVAKRGNLKIEYPSNTQAKKLWKILEGRFKV
jgi:hypothetical protein